MKKRYFNITERFVEKLKPQKNDAIYYDETQKGFGVRITAGGVVSFVLNYRIQGRERRATIGEPSFRYWPRFTVKDARARAHEMRQQIAEGIDPLGKRDAERTAPTISDLAERYLTEHAEPMKRPISVRDDRAMLRRVILPRFGNLHITALTRLDVESLRNSLRSKPYYANRVLALLSTMFNCAKGWGLAEGNPVKGVPRFDEDPREAWLHEHELYALGLALREYPDRNLADAIRLLMLTGSRHSEVLTAKWADFDLERGRWTKPSHATKHRKTEHVPLNQAALSVLVSMPRMGPYLFPGKNGNGHRESLRKPWRDVLKAAHLPKTLRVHDLRHTFASTLVSEGASLYAVGKLLGHTRHQTTQRYAHLAPHALQETTERLGKAYGSMLQ